MINTHKKVSSHENTRRVCDAISIIFTESSTRYFLKDFIRTTRSSSDRHAPTLEPVSILSLIPFDSPKWILLVTPGKWNTTECGSPEPTCKYNTFSMGKYFCLTWDNCISLISNKNLHKQKIIP